MFDSIYTAMTGLTAFSDGLRTISSNVANMNTAGFRGSETSFTNLFAAGANVGEGTSGEVRGGGVSVSGHPLDFLPGVTQTTGNATDVAISGDSYFVLKEDDGSLSYTRDGQFHLDGSKLEASDGSPVQAMGNDGLEAFDIGSVLQSAPKATTSITFSADSYLSSGMTGSTTPYTTQVTVFDALGASHQLTLQFEEDASDATKFTFTVLDGTTPVGTPQTLTFDAAGNISPTSDSTSIDYTPTNGAPDLDIAVSFDGVRELSSSGTASDMSGATADGWAAGAMQSATFDASGTLKIVYTNGQNADGPQLALARVDHPDQLVEVSGSRLQSKDTNGVHFGVSSDTFGTILPEQIEGSNVDLSEQFSEIILEQRGYQACSEVISTANQMIDSLMHMRSES